MTTPTCLSCGASMMPRFRGCDPQHWRCGKCGLECISPQPDDKVLAAIYDKSYYSHYTANANYSVVREMKRATYAKQLRSLIPPGSFSSLPRLLDCGAATGFLAELAQESGWDAYALELSSFGSRACAELLGADHVYCGTLENASFPANPRDSFDAITMFDFIEHVRDPLRVLDAARHRLNSGGSLLLTTPQAGSMSWRLMAHQWFHYIEEHLWFFTPASITSLLSRVGFREVTVRPLPKAITVGYALAYYARRTSQNAILTPIARFLDSHSHEGVKRLRLWCHLGEMVVLARA